MGARRTLDYDGSSNTTINSHKEGRHERSANRIRLAQIGTAVHRAKETHHRNVSRKLELLGVDLHRGHELDSGSNSRFTAVQTGQQRRATRCCTGQARLGNFGNVQTLHGLAAFQGLTIDRRFEPIPDQLPVVRVALNLRRVQKLERDAVAVADSASRQSEGLQLSHGAGLRGCRGARGHALWSLNAKALANLQDGSAERVAWLTRLSRRQIGNGRLPAANEARQLALGDALLENCGDVVFPLHASDYIGLPIFYQAVYRYRNSVCYAP